VAFQRNAFQRNAFQVGGVSAPPVVSGGQQGAPVGWGTQRWHGVAGQRRDDIEVGTRAPNRFDKLRIQEIDNHDIMLFVKTFRQFNQ
jgi:hypothetical protein